MIVSLVDTRTNTGHQVTMITKDLYIGFGSRLRDDIINVKNECSERQTFVIL